MHRDRKIDVYTGTDADMLIFLFSPPKKTLDIKLLISSNYRHKK